jgi:hypothetical protein
VPIIDPLWTEVRATNRAILDTTLLVLAAWPVPYGSSACHGIRSYRRATTTPRQNSGSHDARL